MRTKEEIEAEAVADLNAMTEDGDQELSHSEADDILVRVLTEAGYIEVAAAFEAARERVGFWYA